MAIAAALFIFSTKKDNTELILLLLFAMMYKAILKDIFKLPAPLTSPTLNYGFPSGHMNFATVFYVFLMFKYSTKSMYILGITSLILTGWSIVYFGYHTISDVILTPLFGIFSVGLYRVLLGETNKNIIILIFMIAATVCQMISLILIDSMKCDLIIGSYATFGFGSSILFQNDPKKLVISFACLILFFLFSDDVTQSVLNMKWSVIFALLPIFKKQASRRRCKIKDN
jgi:hypothetical protein